MLMIRIKKDNMNDNTVTIREYMPENKEAVMDLIRLNTPAYFAPEEEEDFSRYLDNERELYYVLLWDGKIVGCGGINLADHQTTGRISWDIFHPQYQGRSLGTRLMQYRIEKLESIGTVRKSQSGLRKWLTAFMKNRDLSCARSGKTIGRKDSICTGWNTGGGGNKRIIFRHGKLPGPRFTPACCFII